MAGKELVAQGEARRQAILRFLRSYIAREGFAPTIQEIADAVNLVSPNATRNHLQKLADEGYIKMRPRVARGIGLVTPAPDAIDLQARTLYLGDQRRDPKVGSGRSWGQASKTWRQRYLDLAREQAEAEAAQKVAS